MGKLAFALMIILFQGVAVCAASGGKPEDALNVDSRHAQVVATNDIQRAAVQIVQELLAEINSEQEFTRKKEDYFFRGTTYLQYILHQNLGYMDDAGRWRRLPPKVSHLGMLLKLNKDLFKPTSTDDRIDFAVVYVKDREKMIFDRILVVAVFNRDQGDFAYCSPERQKPWSSKCSAIKINRVRH